MSICHEPLRSVTLYRFSHGYERFELYLAEQAVEMLQTGGGTNARQAQEGMAGMSGMRDM